MKRLLRRSWVPFCLHLHALGFLFGWLLLLLGSSWPPFGHPKSPKNRKAATIHQKFAKVHQKITKELLLNASWAHFGCSCAQLGSSWPLLGAIWENFARSWAQLGTPNGLPGLILLPAVCSLVPAASFLQNVCLPPAVCSPLPAACKPVAWQSLAKTAKSRRKPTQSF